MVRAVLEDGVIRPLGPLPAEWREGQSLLIEAEAEESPEDVAAWTREIEEAAQRIPEEDHVRFLEALEEQRRLSKEYVRRQMELS